MQNATLLFIATLGSFILLGLLIFFPLPDKNAQTFLALASFVMGFYFGSSVNKQRPALPVEEVKDAKVPAPASDPTDA